MSEEFKKYVNEKAKEARKVPDFPFNVSLRKHFSICFPDLINTKWKLNFITRSDIDYEILIDDIKINVKKVNTPNGIKYIYNLRLNCDNCNKEIQENMIISEILSLNRVLNRKNLCENCSKKLSAKYF